MWYYNEPTVKNMIGATLLDMIPVTAEYRPDYIDQIHFVTDRGLFVAWAEGDCCAHAWIDEVAGWESCMGGVITGINTQDEHEVPLEDSWDVRDAFTEVLSTTQGDLAMFCFTDHNGYYSGWIVWTT